MRPDDKYQHMSTEALCAVCAQVTETWKFLEFERNRVLDERTSIREHRLMLLRRKQDMEKAIKKRQLQLF